MFKNIKDGFINMVTSRLFVLFIVMLGMGGLLLYRIFTLQIVNGEAYFNDFKLMIKKERTIDSTRGKIYDRKGNLLAYNELAYSVTIEDVFESGKDKNAKLNQTIYDLVKLIEKNYDKIINDFNITLNGDGNYIFTVEDRKLLRFLADVYGSKSIDDLKYFQKTATPDEVMDFLGDSGNFGIGAYRDPDDRKSFEPGAGYTKQERLQITTVRYAMNANSFQKYIPTSVATEVSDKTVAVVMENSADLEGVSIEEDTIRKYVDSVYFSHIIGYTGKISADELTSLQKEDDSYVMNDMVGKAGIEQVMEMELQGQKGSETLYVDNLGKVIETSDKADPVAGNDLHLTIDMDLQKATYSILEQKIAGILVSKIRPIKEYVAGENPNASNVVIPIDDVYYALFNNNIIDTAHLADKNASETEVEVYENFQRKQSEVFAVLREEMTTTGTPYNMLEKEYQMYQSHIVSMLSNKNKGVLLDHKIDTEDPTYIAWKKDETISLKEYLSHAIAMNWIDITKINLKSQYADADEIYNTLLDYIFANLENTTEFSKRIYKFMIRDNTLTGKQVCLLLWEQNVVDIDSAEIERLRQGAISPYSFMLKRIEALDITPAQLALDPHSGSSVVTNVEGEILAMVTYPSYDNNRLANSIDSDYYAALQADLSLPLWDYATQQLSAPGSTYKMVLTAAALEEGVTDTTETINCTGVYERVNTPFKCWNNSGHGSLNISNSIRNSCNFFFYDMGYRLSINAAGSYDNEFGLGRIAKYADMFGLSEKSGVELEESVPKVSNKDAVPSAIGQGTNNFTTAGLARYVTTVANSGTCYDISLLGKLTDPNGKEIMDYKPKIRNQVELAPSTWNAMHTGMRGVIEDKAYYNDMPVVVAGKTGTAQEDKSRANHALFVGYAPYENPEIAIATRVAFGYTSANAAEISRDVLKYYFNPDLEKDLITGTAVVPEAQGNSGD